MSSFSLYYLSSFTADVMAHDKNDILWQKYDVMYFALYHGLHTIFDFPFLFYFYTIMHFSLFTRTCTPSCIFLVYYDLYTVMHFSCLLLYTVVNCLVYYDLYTVVHFPCLL